MDDVQQILDFEYEKFVDPEKRLCMAGSKTISGKLCRKRTCISETKQNMTV